MRRFVLVDDAFKRPLAPIRKRLPGDRASGTEPPRDFACGVDGESVEPCAVRQRVTGAGTGDKWGKFRDRDVVPGVADVAVVLPVATVVPTAIQWPRCGTVTLEAV